MGEFAFVVGLGDMNINIFCFYRLWIVFPSIIVWVLGKSIIQSLTIASSKVHSKKMI